ncbi:Sodium/calcium exchanger protein-domain-containing protein [Phellopilus nigrolimitatus]|nr:Sodium/calcium exchanger protein-domain-containing protein [Phellopilus nigrolimitatus]
MLSMATPSYPKSKTAPRSYTGWTSSMCSRNRGISSAASRSCCCLQTAGKSAVARDRHNILPVALRLPLAYPFPTHTPRLSQIPSFSLVGALEFRQVVASLQHQSARASLTVSQDAWDNALPLHARSPRSQMLALPEDGASAFSNLSPPLGIPRIETTPASPSSETSTDANGLVHVLLSYPRTRPQRMAHAIQHTLHVLFPTLHGFREKRVAGKLASVLAAPTVLALTVTLPVGSTVPEARLVDFEEEGIERVLMTEEDVQEEMHELKLNKWLMAVQMVFGLLFCVTVLFRGMQRHREAWLLAATAIAGSTAAAFVLVFAGRGTNSVAQMVRCSMGFFVAVVWIMAIADEVVNVLKTFGFIFGLSNTIIGLTVFAVGNSLADFVANISVTVFAPVMGFSTCFGGPILNILLGVGVSGTAVIRSASGVPFEVDFSATPLVSTVGLLATLVCVPLNDHHFMCC